MADTKISALTAVTTPADTDEFGVNQGGTSKKMTLAQIRAYPVYNVKQDYGAVGNGTVDDTTAIQNAIDAAHAVGGGIVFLPKGSYKITTRLTLYGNITLKGSGKYTSVIYPTGCDGIYFIPASPVWNDTEEHLVLEDFALQGDYTAGKIGIQLANIRWWNISRLRISAFKSHGIKIYESYASTIRDCDIFDNDGSGIFLGGAANNILIESGEIAGNNASGITLDGTGYTHTVVYGTRIIGVTIEGNALSGVRLVDGVSSTTIRDCYFELNQSPSSGGSRTPPTQPVVGYSIEVGTGEQTTIGGTVIEGNLLIPGAGSGTTGYGVYLGLCQGMVIVGNSVDATGLWKVGMSGWANITAFLAHGNDDANTTSPHTRGGSSTFNGVTGRDITTNIEASVDQTQFPYRVAITPTAAMLGHFYIVKSTNKFTVYSSEAGDTGAFDWAIVSDG